MSLAMIVAFDACSSKEKDSSDKEKEESSASSVSEEETVELKPVDQIAELSGKVGPSSVHMTLNVKGDLVEGEYSYDRFNSPLKLQGKLEEDGHLELNEVNKDGKPTGHFNGYYGKDYGFNGEFVNFKGARYDFNLNVDNVTDNAGDGDGRGFMVVLPPDSPARSGYLPSSNYEFADDDYSGGGYSEGAGDSSIDEMLDSYENYVNRYIQLMKKAANGDMSAAAEYAQLYQEAIELQSRLENVSGEMSTAQINRMNRINNKLLQAAQ